jgi:large subunit ribosomal protein L17
MSHKVAVRKKGKDSGFRRAMHRNLVTDLLGYEKIKTTEAKARQIRSIAEKMITLGKRGGLHSRRQVISYILSKEVIEKLFSELAERYAERPGGYTRTTKLGRRLGDGALMVQIELVK